MSTKFDEIFQILENRFSNPIRRLKQSELNQYSINKFVAGWEFDITTEYTSDNAKSLHLLIPDNFPYSQPRIAAPELRLLSWPHVESGGLLCLHTSKAQASTKQRINDHIDWAIQLLKMPKSECLYDFQREFSTYWNHSIDYDAITISFFSLLKPRGPSRFIYSYYNSSTSYYIADDKKTLENWLKNKGTEIHASTIKKIWFEWLNKPWIPAQFPSTGTDLFNLFSEEKVSEFITPGMDIETIFGAMTETGPVLVATVLKSPKLSTISKGFRSYLHVPTKHLINRYKTQKLIKCKVYRIDASWITGRDHNEEHRSLFIRKAVLVGCGSIGSAVSRFLAQAGVGNFILIDGDELYPHNTSRHILGQRYSGTNKALATKSMLAYDFPHINSSIAISKRFELLDDTEIELISNCDIIISSGLDYDSDAQIDHWRQSQNMTPIHICTWTEEFALAGHAIALFGSDSILDAFDDDELVKFRISDWPAKSNAFLVEAGCGNIFQPHGSVDLQSIITLASRLAIDALTGKINVSTHRAWIGDIDNVRKKGGELRSDIEQKNCVLEYQWNP